MTVNVKALSKSDLGLPMHIRNEFTVDSVLQLSMKDGVIQYEAVSVPAYTKHYPDDLLPMAEYIENPDKYLVIARTDQAIVGLAAVSRNWNGLALLEELKVDTDYRRHGLGKRLIDVVKEWARVRGMAGIMLETQHNNVLACKFYEGYGFTIGGFDRYVYKAIEPSKDEVALYWYLMLS
ncbi:MULTISPECIES: GNAT family N-acetyltransferase [Paenibacillus]|uniref:GNAT family N-acetyltransferase n=1 Tax=Paenibacillus TaxID=44249 RepID=UPI002FE21F08